MTKEKLILENQELKNQVARLKANIENDLDAELKVRKEFAKAFGNRVGERPFMNDREKRTPSWSEIFVQIGRLLVLQEKDAKEEEIADYRATIDRLNMRLNELQ